MGWSQMQSSSVTSASTFLPSSKSGSTSAPKHFTGGGGGASASTAFLGVLLLRAEPEAIAFSSRSSARFFFSASRTFSSSAFVSARRWLRPARCSSSSVRRMPRGLGTGTTWVNTCSMAATMRNFLFLMQCDWFSISEHWRSQMRIAVIASSRVVAFLGIRSKSTGTYFCIATVCPAQQKRLTEYKTTQPKPSPATIALEVYLGQSRC
jgi:hypothetical protein